MSLVNAGDFFDHVRTNLYHGFIYQGEVDGLNAFLAEWDQIDPRADVRFVACALGQAYHETDCSMQPIAEYGKGVGHPYGVPDPVTGQTYYGRGYIQLTWKYNYQRADAELQRMGILAPDESLVTNPDLALDPKIAASIMIHGMLEGWFTGKKLSDFFDAHHTDFLHSRQIINGMDRAYTVASYGKLFMIALQAGGYT